MDEADWDVIVIGTGSGGKIAAQQLGGAGRRVLAIEAGRFGGECPYVACVPAKSILAAARAGLSWAEAVERRDDMSDHRNDRAGRKSLEDEGVVTVRGRARLLSPHRGMHRVEIDGQDALSAAGSPLDAVQSARAVVVATGSSPTIPPVNGLDQLDYWTSDQALSTKEQPARLGILGGGAIGCELAQAFAGLGTQVQLVEIADHLLPDEAAWVGNLVADQLRADGVHVAVGVQPERAEHINGHDRLHLRDGRVLVVDRVLVAGGRHPNTDDLGLAEAGIALEESGAVAVDDHCRTVGPDGRPVPGLYAVGDVTGESAYTHSANYQAKIAAADILGHGRAADYRAIPRVVYTQPAVFTVGLTPDRARDEGVQVRTARVDVADVERAALLEANSQPRTTVRGGLELVFAGDRLVGASAVGPDADSWAGELALAIRAEVTLSVLRDHVRAFPTWSEAITAVLDEPHDP